MSRIFISYRRDDSGGRLAAHFEPDNIFMDIDAIEPGLDFVEVIEKAVGSCDVLIALIGWLTIKDAQDRRPLDNPEDFARLEVKTALVGGAAIPISTEPRPSAVYRITKTVLPCLSPHKD